MLILYHWGSPKEGKGGSKGVWGEGGEGYKRGERQKGREICGVVGFRVFMAFWMEQGDGEEGRGRGINLPAPPLLRSLCPGLCRCWLDW